MAKTRRGLAEGIVEAVRIFKDNGVLAGLRAATADGQGAYLLAMFMFGLAALAFHYAILPQTSRENRLEQTLSQKQEALAGEHYPVLAGLVIQPAEPMICDSRWDDLRNQLDRLAARFAAEVGTMSSGSEATPIPDLEPACNVVTPNVGPVWTDTGSKLSTLFIPSTVAARAAPSCGICTGNGSAACAADGRTKLIGDFGEVLRASQALDRLVEDGGQDARLCRPRELRPAGDTAQRGNLPVCGSPSTTPTESAAKDYSIRTLYFVSIDGITRTLNVDDDGAVIAPESGTARVRRYLPHFVNNGTTYFLETISRPARNGCRSHARDRQSSASRSGDKSRVADPKLTGFVTEPYFDRFGGGLVETFCRSIISNDKLLGVLCVDVAHSEKSVIDKLTELDAFDVSIVQIDPPAQSAKHAADDGDDGDLPKPEIHLCNAMRPELCPPRLSAARISAADLTQFAWLYYLNRLAGPHELRKGGVYSNGCQKARDCKFGVTVYSGMKGDVPFWDVAVIRLLRPQARDYLALLACALSLMSGIASLTLGYRKKTRVREAYFVRGLALGAIHVGADDQVVGGNDRAEAILGRDLPRMAIHDTEVGIDPSTFSSFIDPSRCVVIDASGRIGADTVVSYDVIRWRCAEELTLAFYGYLWLRGWVRVTARVIVQPQQQDDLLFVIDTHVCEQHREILQQIRAKPVPTTRLQEARRELLERPLPHELESTSAQGSGTITLLGKITMLYFCEEPDRDRIESWARAMRPGPDKPQIVLVTDHKDRDDYKHDGRSSIPVIARDAVQDLRIAKDMSTLVIVDPRPMICEVVVGDDPIAHFIEGRLGELVRRIRL